MVDDSLYSRYLQALLAGDRASCYTAVRGLLDGGTPIKTLYVYLFQRSLYEVGSLWEKNTISVAVEHGATAITESLMGLMYPEIFFSSHNGRKAVISCVANEYHQVGGKMVADIFELHGWDGFFLGANTPAPELFRMIDEKEPDILGLSLSIYFNIAKLYDLLEKVGKRFPDLKVIAGGQAFLWGEVDIEERFPGVKLISTLDQLEDFIHREEPA